MKVLLLFLLVATCSGQQMATMFEVHFDNISLPRLGYKIDVLECLKLYGPASNEDLASAVMTGMSCYSIANPEPETDIFSITQSLRQAGYEVTFEASTPSDDMPDVNSRLFIQSFQNQLFFNKFVTLTYFLDATETLVFLVYQQDTKEPE